MEPPPPMISAPELGGWYLRGDVGVAANTTAPALFNTPNPLAGNYWGAGANQSFNNTNLSASTVFDLGVGYQFNRWFRSDVTFEYRGGGRLQTLYAINNPNFATSGTATASQLLDAYRADTSSFIGMLNGYADLGTWYGLTPYVGAGVGFSNNYLTGMTDQGQITQGANGATSSSGGFFSNGSKTNFAYALMAGVDFDVTQNLKMELGYRYLNYGKIGSGASNCANGNGQGNGFGNGNCGGGVANFVASSNRLASNDFRLGFRYMIGEAPAPAPVMSAPLIRKY